MAVVKAREVSGFRTPVREAAQLSGVGRDRVQRASDVIAYAPDLTDAVLSGAESLDQAYQHALTAKQRAEPDRV